MNYILVLFFLILSFGCVSVPVSRSPSEYLLTTDKNVAEVLHDVRVKLEENKYKIKAENVEAGILLTSPRQFSFEKEGQKIIGRQTLQMRQEGGSVKLRIVYDCKYMDEFESCHRNDQHVQAKINRLEPALINMIKPLLMKQNDSKKKESELESFEDWGVPPK